MWSVAGVQIVAREWREMKRGGGGEGIPPRCFSCSLFFPLSSQYERLEHARQRETTVPVS